VSDAGYVLAGYVVTVVVLVAYVAWMAWRFRRVRASMTDEDLTRVRAREGRP